MQPRPMTEFPTANLPAAQTETVRMPELSGPLRSWLLEEVSDAKAVEVITKSDLLRGQAAMMLPVLRQEALRPATEAEIVAIIRSREQTFGDLRISRTESEWATFYADYFEALAGLTASAIESGMKAYIALPDSDWAPKPGKLAHLARTTPTTGRFARAYNRAKAAVVQHQQATAPKPLPGPKHSPEEVKAMVSETLAALSETPTAKLMAARHAARPRTPSAPLPPGSHMSAEMRAKLGKAA